jgi:hypothetical protein
VAVHLSKISVEQQVEKLTEGRRKSNRKITNATKKLRNYIEEQELFQAEITTNKSRLEYIK